MITWIEELTEKERESFHAFCKKTLSPIQMYLYARFLGFTGSIVECDEWAQKIHSKKNFNAILEEEIDLMRTLKSALDPHCILSPGRVI